MNWSFVFIKFIHIISLYLICGQCAVDEERNVDDIGIFNWNKNEVEQRVNLLYQAFEEMGLELDLTKTETMMLNWNENNYGAYSESILKILDAELGNNKNFK